MSAEVPSRILGVGSPIVDFLAQVPETHLRKVHGAKGGMVLVDGKEMAALLADLETPPSVAPGGSAANTTFALARLGLPCAFLGKLGEDSVGRTYRDAFVGEGGDASAFKWTSDEPTAQCLSLITPDSERTLRTHLGAAMLLSPDEVTAADFAGCRHAHVEGYLLFNRELAVKVLRTAKEAGCTVSLDLGSFEVVRAASDILEGLLNEYVDMVFANEDEAEAFCKCCDPEEALEKLAAHCEIAAVKVGAEGAYLRRGPEQCHLPAVPLPDAWVVDTTGAGDLWAAGFLYGRLSGKSLAESAQMGAVMGAEVVQVVGAALDDAAWARVKSAVTAL